MGVWCCDLDLPSRSSKGHLKHITNTGPLLCSIRSLQVHYEEKLNFDLVLRKIKNFIKSKNFNEYISKSNQVLRSYRGMFLPGLEEIIKIFLKLSCRQAFSYNEVL